MLAPVKLDRSWLRLLLLVPILPWLIAVGLGIPNRAGGRIDGWIHQALFFTSDVIPFVEVLFAGPVRAVLALVAAGLLVGALAALEHRAPPWLAWLPSLPEAVLVLAGLVAATGLFAVGCGLDRWLFWGGLGVATLAARAFEPARPSAVTAAPRPRPWTDPTHNGSRLLVLAVAVGLVLLAGVTLLEGPSYHSPPFRLRDLWLAGPGRSGWISGGLWLLPGTVVVVLLWSGRRRMSGLPRRWWPWLLVVGVIAVAARIHQHWIGPGGDYRIGSILSAIGLLSIACGCLAGCSTASATRCSAGLVVSTGLAGCAVSDG